MRYGTRPFSTAYQTQLIIFFPFLKENYGELTVDIQTNN